MLSAAVSQRRLAVPATKLSARPASRFPKRATHLRRPNHPTAPRIAAAPGPHPGAHSARCGALAAPARPASALAVPVSARNFRRHDLRESASHDHLVQRIFDNALGVRCLQPRNDLPGRRLFNNGVHRDPGVIAQRGHGRLLQSRQARRAPPPGPTCGRSASGRPGPGPPSRRAASRPGFRSCGACRRLSRRKCWR